jgi:hypothetical protein
MTGSQVSSPRYVNVSRLASYIDSTPASVRQMVQTRRIPHIRVAGGRRILFDLRVIDCWLGRFEVAASEVTDH